jgi:WD40 repeat protein
MGLVTSPPLLAQEPKLRATLNGDLIPWVHSLAFSPDGDTLASASGRAISLWDVTSGKNTATFAWLGAGYGPVVFTPDGKTLVSVWRTCGKDIMLLDAATAKETGSFGVPGHGSGLLAFSQDGTTVAAEDWEDVLVYDVAARKQVSRLLKKDLKYAHKKDLKYAHPSSMALNPNGKTLAVGITDGTIELLEAATGKPFATLKGHTEIVESMAFSPDGNTLASGSGDKTIKLWNVARGENTATLKGHTGSVWCVAFSPDGKTLASGGSDSTVKLWDVTTAENTATLNRHTEVTRSLAFSPDGKTLASGTSDAGATDVPGCIHLWDVKPVKDSEK